MTRAILIGLLGLAALAGLEGTSPARPCRPGHPSCRRPPPPPPPPPPAAGVTIVYRRAIPARLGIPRSAADVVRLLVGSPWTRLGSRQQLRFLTRPAASGTGHFAQPPGGAAAPAPAPRRDRGIRAVPIDLTRVGRTFLVTIDGEAYAITPCQMPRPGADRRPVVVPTTCLEHRRATGAFGGQGYGGYGGVTYGGR